MHRFWSSLKLHSGISTSQVMTLIDVYGTSNSKNKIMHKKAKASFLPVDWSSQMIGRLDQWMKKREMFELTIHQQTAPTSDAVTFDLCFFCRSRKAFGGFFVWSASFCRQKEQKLTCCVLGGCRLHRKLTWNCRRRMHLLSTARRTKNLRTWPAVMPCVHLVAALSLTFRVRSDHSIKALVQIVPVLCSDSHLFLQTTMTPQKEAGIGGGPLSFTSCSHSLRLLVKLWSFLETQTFDVWICAQQLPASHTILWVQRSCDFIELLLFWFKV